MAIIGMDIHRSFAQAAFLQDGQVKREQRVDLVHDRLIRFGKSLSIEDEVVIEATGNSAAVERILRPFVKRVVVANPRMVRAIAYARVMPIPTKPPVCNGMIAPRDSWMMPPPVTR